MMNATSVSQTYHLGPTVIRFPATPIHDLANEIAAVVQAGAPDWEVDRLDDDDGSVLVSRPNERDGEPCYVISPTAEGIELSEMRDDVPRKLGRFDTLRQASNALLALLTSGSGQ